MTGVRHLELWDYVSLCCLVILSSIVGLYHIFTARKSKATKDFLVASNDLGIFPLILSSVATFYSAIGMIAFPLESYYNGINFLLIAIPSLIAIPIGCYVYLPVFFKLNNDSMFQYLEMRFNKIIRNFASLLFVIQTIIYTSCVMYVPALALNQVAGIDLWASVATIAIVCIVYTSMGGIKAVVWADVTQCLVMMTIFALIIGKSSIDIGGSDVIWERLTAGNREVIFNWSSTPHSQYTFWTMAIACPLHITSSLVVNQSLLQRYLSNKTLKRSQISFIGTAFGVAIGYVLIGVEGILMYAYFYDCDPMLGGRVKTRDQSMALFAVETLSFCKGLAGVFVAGIMCATLSTLSSMLNSLTAITLSDYVSAFKPELSDQTTLKLSKLLVVFYGLFCMALVVVVENMGEISQVIFGIFGLTGGPMFTIFTIGLLLPWVDTKGAAIGCFCSILLPLWAWTGKLVTSPALPHAPLSTRGCDNFTAVTNVTMATAQTGFLYDLYTTHAFWYDFWSITVGLIASLIAGKIIGFQDPKQVNPNLLFNFVRNYVHRNQKQKSNNNFGISFHTVLSMTS